MSLFGIFLKTVKSFERKETVKEMDLISSASQPRRYQLNVVPKSFYVWGRNFITVI